MTLESTVEFDHMVNAVLVGREFFNEDDPHMDHQTLGQRVGITWHEVGRLYSTMKIINNKFQKITVAIIFSWLIFFVLIPNLLVLTVSF